MHVNSFILEATVKFKKKGENIYFCIHSWTLGLLDTWISPVGLFEDILCFYSLVQEDAAALFFREAQEMFCDYETWPFYRHEDD